MPPQPPPRRTPSPERKAILYVGGLIMLIGAGLFLSTFVTSAMNFGNFNNFNQRVRSESLRAVIGMIMMIVGGIVSAVGSNASSGMGITPELGQMLNDAPKDRSSPPPPAPVVMVRCQYCKALNDETAKSCTQCGGRLV